MLQSLSRHILRQFLYSNTPTRPLRETEEGTIFAGQEVADGVIMTWPRDKTLIYDSEYSDDDDPEALKPWKSDPSTLAESETPPAVNGTGACSSMSQNEAMKSKRITRHANRRRSIESIPEEKAAELTPSDFLKALLGAQANPNTARMTKVGMRAWCSIILGESSQATDDLAEMWKIVCAHVLTDFDGDLSLSTLSRRNLNISFASFVAKYRQSNGSRISPSSLISYLDGINRFLKSKNFNVTKRRDAIFNNSNDGYMTAVNTIGRGQQAEGCHRRPHNVILDSEICAILSHPLTDSTTPKGYANWLIIIVELLTGLCATRLRKLSWNNFKQCKDINGKNAYRYVRSVGMNGGECKNQKGGVNSVKDVPTHFMIVDQDLAFGINPFKVIQRHSEECKKLPEQPTNCFL